MTRKLAFLAALFFLGLAATAAADPIYQVVSSETRRIGPLTVTGEAIQAGDDPAARFTLHRMVKEDAARRGALLLMPGGASNFVFYTADEDGKELQSFAAYFALRGIEVWGYSPRTRGLAPGACSGAVDCSGNRLLLTKRRERAKRWVYHQCDAGGSRRGGGRSRTAAGRISIREVTMATVFLSYSSADRALAKSIASALEAKGHEVRYDAGLEVGDEWRRDLLETLHASDALLVLLTENSLSSQAVAAEVGAARALGLERGMFILPVVVGDLPIPPFVQDIFAAPLPPPGKGGEIDKEKIEDVAAAIDRGIAKHYTRLRGKYPRIFISHRHKDEEMVAALIALIEAAFAVGPGDIRCTSIHPYKLAAGERTPDRLRAEIGRARAVLGILTPDTKESSYVLFELGASWSQRALTLPLLAKGATQADIPHPISDRHPLHLTDAKDCRQLLTDLAYATGWARQPDDSKIEESIKQLIGLASAPAS